MKALVGVGQFTPHLFEIQKNTDKIISLIDQAAKKGIELFVLPEYSRSGVPREEDVSIKKRLHEVAEKVPGDLSNIVIEKAKEHAMHIFLSTIEVEGDNLFNCGLFVSPDGGLHKYRKIHLYKGKAIPETYYMENGNDFLLIDTALGKIGLLICYDSVFPESARVLTLKGAQILLVSAAWPKEGRLRYKYQIVSRAIENQVYVLASGVCGDIFNGNSMIIDYKGNIIEQLNDETGIACATIDIEGLNEWRNNILPYLKDRRPELYQEIVMENKKDMPSTGK